MITSKAGLDTIKHFEGIHDGDLKTIGLQPKMDPIGIWTEGYGRAMRDKKGNFIRGAENKKLAYDSITIHNEVEAIKALAQDCAVREYTVAQRIKVPLTQNQFDALVSLIYNTGGSETIYQLINNKQSKQAIFEFWTKHYITGDGVILPGLVARRKAEADLFVK